MGFWLEVIVQLVNIWEWLDFFCVLFDLDGNLVVNVLYILVYFGLMGIIVKEVICWCLSGMKFGDVYVVNDLYYGGIYLLDIIVIILVFNIGGEDVLFFVVFCGYYVEIGGIIFGFMFVDSCEIYEEGVLFDNWLFVENGWFCEVEIWCLFIEVLFGFCNFDINFVDLCVQIVVN